MTPHFPCDLEIRNIDSLGRRIDNLDEMADAVIALA